MKPWIWMRIAAVLQGIGTVLHTIASQYSTSRGPGEQAVFDAMRSFRFDIMGANRSHWDFYNGYEVSTTVVFAVLAVLMWQLGNLSRSAPDHARPLILTMLVYQILMDVVSWTYFFAGPGVMSILISVCLIAALLTMSRVEVSSRGIKAS
jgi:uncharacterized MAPEG superfamily protein